MGQAILFNSDIRSVTLMMVLAFTMTCANKAGVDDAGTIYYEPLGMDTYSPVTPDSIQSRPSEVISLDKATLVRFRELLSRRIAGKFDPMITRVKCVSREFTIVVDNEGGVRDGSLEYRIPRESLLQLKRLIEQRTRRVYETTNWPP